MIILIGGASYTGKTLMAQKLLEIYKMPYLSIDHLKMGIYRGNADCGFTPESKTEVITAKLWPITKEVILTSIENSQNMIIEGCYFPDSPDEFTKDYLSQIIFFYIIFSEQYIRKNWATKIAKNRNIIENRRYIFEYTNLSIEQYILEHKKNKEICITNGIKYIEIMEDYEKEMEAIFEWIKNEVTNIKARD